MYNIDTIPQYLRRFTQVRDEFARVGVTFSKDDLASVALLSLPKSWRSYQDSMNEREKLPN